MSIKATACGSLTALLAAAALSCGGANAEPLFAFLNSPRPMQIAPQTTYEALPADRGEYVGQPQARETQLPPELRRQVVSYTGKEAAGTIVVDTPNTYLYYVLGGGKAIRYGIGVGREGFTWAGVKSIERKAEWPDWYPPSEMLARQPYLPRMTAGGPGNPLGARALYIGGTQYRIHGTNAPDTIGKNVSSGCIRMLNADVIDLYERVKVGAKVVVLPQTYEARTKTHPRHAQTQTQTQQVSLNTAYSASSESSASRAWSTIRPAGLN